MYVHERNHIHITLIMICCCICSVFLLLFISCLNHKLNFIIGFCIGNKYAFVPSVVSGIHWGSWNVSFKDKKELLYFTGIMLNLYVNIDDNQNLMNIGLPFQGHVAPSLLFKTILFPSGHFTSFL